RRREIGHVEPLCELVGQPDVAEIDDDLAAFAAQVGRGTVAAESHHDAAFAVLAATEIDVGHLGTMARAGLGRVVADYRGGPGTKVMSCSVLSARAVPASDSATHASSAHPRAGRRARVGLRKDTKKLVIMQVSPKWAICSRARSWPVFRSNRRPRWEPARPA